jgi:hypothetical protein
MSGDHDFESGMIQYGMVGGGQGAFIGGVHRIAARLDGAFSLVAGALSSTPTTVRWRGPKQRAPTASRPLLS